MICCASKLPGKSAGTAPSWILIFTCLSLLKIANDMAIAAYTHAPNAPIVSTPEVKALISATSLLVLGCCCCCFTSTGVVVVVVGVGLAFWWGFFGQSCTDRSGLRGTQPPLLPLWSL